MLRKIKTYLPNHYFAEVDGKLRGTLSSNSYVSIVYVEYDRVDELYYAHLLMFTEQGDKEIDLTDVKLSVLLDAVVNALEKHGIKP